HLKPAESWDSWIGMELQGSFWALVVADPIWWFDPTRMVYYNLTLYCEGKYYMGIQLNKPLVIPATTGPVTTGPITTGEMTTGVFTTGAITTGSVTTGPVTTGILTTSDSSATTSSKEGNSLNFPYHFSLHIIILGSDSRFRH